MNKAHSEATRAAWNEPKPEARMRAESLAADIEDGRIPDFDTLRGVRTFQDGSHLIGWRENGQTAAVLALAADCETQFSNIRFQAPAPLDTDDVDETDPNAQ